MDNIIKVSIIILTYNNLEKNTIPCFESIVKYTDLSCNEVIIVDNASSDKTSQWIKEQERKFDNVIGILNSSNLGYAAGNNAGIKVARGNIVVLLNNDTEVDVNWLDNIIKPFQNKEVGIVGPLTNRIGSLQQVNIPNLTHDNWRYQSRIYCQKYDGMYIPVHKLCFFCVAISKKVIEKIGTLDESFGRGNFEDDDYCMRVHQSFKIVMIEDCFVWHSGSASFNQVPSNELHSLYMTNRRYFEKKHGFIYTHIKTLEDFAKLFNVCEQKKCYEAMKNREKIYKLLLATEYNMQNYFFSERGNSNVVKKIIKKIDKKLFNGCIVALWQIWKLRYINKAIYKDECRKYGLLGMLHSEFIKYNVLPHFTPAVLPKRMPNDIPIFIISYNRLSCLKNLIEVLKTYGLETNITIIDNGSTYEPLLKYLHSISVKVVFLGKNYGHLVLWRCHKFDSVINNRPFVLTDCDVIPFNVPKNFLNFFYDILLENAELTKVGFSLKIDDLPDCNTRKQEVIDWEKRYFVNKLKKYNNIYDAPIDTTFALYRPGIPPVDPFWWNSARTGEPYEAKHLGWYYNDMNPTNEDIYYKNHARHDSSHWFTNDYLIK